MPNRLDQLSHKGPEPFPLDLSKGLEYRNGMLTAQQQMDLLRAGIVNAERTMQRNLARELFGDDYPPPKPATAPYRRFLKILRLSLANLFLRAVNALGAYNEYD